ncbi:MAG: bifunctional glycosyltransferase family 2/GtrA family protein [Firmicutes bacterium]|nr:bifunctional glycosyltransferase family 2/GtrA family protein [Bacillota bacterium]
MQAKEVNLLVLIPAYKPDARMVALCRALRGEELPVLVVDDGSGNAFRPLFEEVMDLGCHVERHAVNLGKGRAIKTGINAALNAFPDLFGVITADADGQHTCADILRIAEVMRKEPHALVMGMRKFAGNVPLKSRAGNAITRHVYRFATGIRCHDTQTGLRGIPGGALPAMLRLPGERYEYEMTMLLRLRSLRLSLREVEIETIYIDGNKGSHFNPLRDAARIYSVIFRFLLSSILSFCVDYALYLFCLKALGLAPWLCYAAARVLSSLFNYQLNRRAVFGGSAGKLSVLRYYLLAVTQLAAGAGLVELLHTALGLSASWVKIPVDTLLFLVSFILQRDFVFR